LGELAITDVICWFRVFRLGFEVSRRIISWRLEGGRVKRIGMDIFFLLGLVFVAVCGVYVWVSSMFLRFELRLSGG